MDADRASTRGGQYCYIWAASNFVCVAFFYLFMPEMKGRSLEELDEMFAARVPVRKFRAYVCAVREEARRDVVGDEKNLDDFVDDEDRKSSDRPVSNGSEKRGIAGTVKELEGTPQGNEQKRNEV